MGEKRDYKEFRFKSRPFSVSPRVLESKRRSDIKEVDITKFRVSVYVALETRAHFVLGHTMIQVPFGSTQLHILESRGPATHQMPVAYPPTSVNGSRYTINGEK
jgi:hypothetical protein